MTGGDKGGVEEGRRPYSPRARAALIITGDVNRSFGDRQEIRVNHHSLCVSPPSTMSKREKFLQACTNQKLDTVRWSLGAGGQRPDVRDDHGYTAIMICAAGNRHKALRMLVDYCRRAREREMMDLADGAGDGRTALMLAAHNGHEEACQELLDAGCNFKVTCDRGLTAADYARKKGHDALAARIDRGGESEEEDTDDEAEEYDSDAPEGETSTQRSKRKKREMEGRERRGAGAGGASAAAAAAAAEEEEAEAAAAAASKERPDPIWPEVKKATEGGLKELAVEAAPGLPLPSGAQVDPALWWASSVNNLKLSIGPVLTVLPSDVGRLSGLKTLILSNNALTALPGAIGQLSQLKVLEAEHNHIASLPAEIANCKALENLRLAHNKLTDLSALGGNNDLVTLVVDGNALTSLDGLNLEAKQRLVTLSAKKNAVEEVPRVMGKCQMLAEIFLSDNQICDLPIELGELKEKKVRAIELEGNPLKDPKVKKMMSKSANLVKELLVYIRKNGTKAGQGDGRKGGGGGKKGKKKAKHVSSSEDESEEEDAPAPAPNPAPAPPPAPAPVTANPAADSDSESEDEDELRERMARMPKKERVKFERKLAEKRAEKAAKQAAKKRAEADAAATAKRAAAIDVMTLGDEDESDIDSDDEEAILARRQRARQAASGGGAYTLTPEQRAAAEKAEADRLAAIQAKKDAEEAEARRILEEKEAEERFAQMRLKEKESGEVMTWVYEKGQILRKPGGIPFKPGKKPGDHPTINVAIPQMIVGRVIGKGGATIRSIEERSKARVRMDEGKGGPGMAMLVVVGDDRAAESVRMMVNNAIGGGGKR